MSDDKIPLHTVPVLDALSRSHGAASFAEIQSTTGLAKATLSRILKTLCTFGYALKCGHGQYMAGPKLVEMGEQLSRNQVIAGFMDELCQLRLATHLNAELYLIAKGGPVFFTHYAAPGEAGVSFRYGHVILNRKHHPAGRFYLALHENETMKGFRENFIVDPGGQWPELFRAAAMVPGTSYCIAVSGMLANVKDEAHQQIREALHTSCDAITASQKAQREAGDQEV